MIDQEEKLTTYFKENDWFVSYIADGSTVAVKNMRFPHLAGTIRDGDRLVVINIDHRWRYVTIVAGFDDYDIDLRDYEDAETAVKALLKLAYGE